jgi:carbon starvation protein
MFGVANQLLAAIALGVGTAVIVKSGKLRYAWTTFVPMLFMFTTTLTASWKLIVMFTDKAVSAISYTEAITFKIDALLVLIMATLAIIVLLDMLYKLHCYISGGLKVVKKRLH